MSQTESEVDLDMVGFVTASRYRRLVLARLAKSPTKPSVIAEDQGLPIANVSRALNGLRDRDLVELLVPEERRKGRIYGLTQKGRDVLARAKQIGEVRR